MKKSTMYSYPMVSQQFQIYSSSFMKKNINL